MSNDTENNQLNGCIVWAVVIAAAIGTVAYYALKFIGSFL